MADNKKQDCCIKKTSIGGQALMEGIMMRGPEMTAMAVRNTDGEIVVEKFPTQGSKRSKFFKLPIIRGVFNYIDAMVLGTKCLMRSAEISGLEEAEEQMKREKEAKKAAQKARKQGKDESNIENIENTEAINEEATQEQCDAASTESNKKSSPLWMSVVMFFSVLLGIGFSVALFVILPTFIYEGAAYLMPFLKPENNLPLESLIKSVFEGVLKILILIGYMAAISLMKDIRRTFMFHGAEHKTIFCYEAGLELTVENVKKQRRFHPRCGTSFLILMLIVGIFISFFIDPLFNLIFGFMPATIVRVAIKILLLPLIVGVGYELIKISGRYDNWFTKIISAPGMWLQHVTVFEPTDDMIECAIIAVNEVIPDNDSDKW
jgi:uncharacterized protein YqhQ